jgi:hypothetical protein
MVVGDPLMPLQSTTADGNGGTRVAERAQGARPTMKMVEAPSWRLKAAGCRFYAFF